MSLDKLPEFSAIWNICRLWRLQDSLQEGAEFH